MLSKHWAIFKNNGTRIASIVAVQIRRPCGQNFIFVDKEKEKGQKETKRIFYTKLRPYFINSVEIRKTKTNRNLKHKSLPLLS